MSTVGTVGGGRGSSFRRGAVVIALAVVAFTVSGLMAPASATPDVVTSRINGANRYETAAQVAIGAFPSGTANAIVVSGTNFPDALSASYIAGALAAPILFTDRSTLSPETYYALGTLGVRAVTIVGGPDAVSENVARQIATMPSPAGGTMPVARIGGTDRYDTNHKVVMAPGTTRVGLVNGVRTALVASGANYPDALASGPMSYASALPLLLTQPTSLAPSVTRMIQDLSIKRVIILGGENAVSSSVASQLASFAEVHRLAGADRFETSSLIARFEIDGLGFSNAQLLLTNGAQFADALAGGPLGGVIRTPILLAFGGGLRQATQDHLDSYKSTLKTLVALGGTTAITDADLAAAAFYAGRGQGPTPPPPSSTSTTFNPALPRTG